MHGARSAVFVRTGRVLSVTCQATRNFSVLEVSNGTVTCCFNLLFTGTCIVRFAVFVRPARVLPVPSQATRNLSFLEVFTGAVTLLFQVVVHVDWHGLY